MADENKEPKPKDAGIGSVEKAKKAKGLLSSLFGGGAADRAGDALSKGSVRRRMDEAEDRAMGK